MSTELSTACTGDELGSIVVVACNGLEFTRHCVENIFRYTRPPYELILVNNGSSDDTLDFFQRCAGRPGPSRIEVIHNELNRGYPVACNQAIEQARGRYLAFVHSDVVVTQGWLGPPPAGNVRPPPARCCPTRL